MFGSPQPHTNLPGLRAPLSNTLVQLRSQTEINLKTTLNFTQCKEKVGKKREHFADRRSRLALASIVLKEKRESWETYSVQINTLLLGHFRDVQEVDSGLNTIQ